jgi:biopolymer transport protein ExbB/TolQ
MYEEQEAHKRRAAIARIERAMDDERAEQRRRMGILDSVAGDIGQYRAEYQNRMQNMGSAVMEVSRHDLPDGVDDPMVEATRTINQFEDEGQRVANAALQRIEEIREDLDRAHRQHMRDLEDEMEDTGKDRSARD